MTSQAFPQARQGPDDSGVGGFALMAMSLADEMAEGFPPEQARGFFHTIGQRMASLETLDGVSDSRAIEGRLNAFWQTLDWGLIEFDLQDDAIIVRHTDLPNKVAPDPKGNWAFMLQCVLEGAYTYWFQLLGSSAELSTTAQWKDDMFELRHGR